MAYDFKISYEIDGLALYPAFGVGVESGSDDLLKFPKRKDSTSHDWLDENGIDVDLTRVFLESREATFDMWLMADNEDDFWTKYNNFCAYMVKPGLRRLTIAELGKDYFVYYKEMKTLSRLTRIKETNKVAIKFTITFEEPDPTTSTEQVFIVDGEGSFIIA
jgi:hypothetical protein